MDPRKITSARIYEINRPLARVFLKEIAGEGGESEPTLESRCRFPPRFALTFPRDFLLLLEFTDPCFDLRSRRAS